MKQKLLLIFALGSIQTALPKNLRNKNTFTPELRQLIHHYQDCEKEQSPSQDKDPIKAHAMHSYTIQQFSPEFTQQVIDLILPIQQNEFQIPITAEQQPDLGNIKGFYQKGNGNFWIAVDDNKVVGTIALLDIGNNQAALRKMFVHKDYRGKEIGVAKKLLDTLLAYAQEQQLSDVYLGTTAAFHAAHRFYEKNGFVEVSKEGLPSSFPVMAVDTKFYRYTIIS